MSSTISASSATEPHATDVVPPNSVAARLLSLVHRAEAQSARMSATNPTRPLLAEMAMAIVALSQRVQMLEEQLADKPRIILPR